MTHRFEFSVTPAATEVQLIGPEGPVPADLWPIETPDTLLRGVDLVQRLIAADSAIAEGNTLLIEHRAMRDCP